MTRAALKIVPEPSQLNIGFIERVPDIWEFQGSTLDEHVNAWQQVDGAVQKDKWKLAAVAASLDTKYDSKTVQKFAGAVKRSPRRVWEYAQTYRAFQKCGRSRELSFQHHTVALASSDPVKAIKQAEENGWSTRELKHEIESAEREKTFKIEDAVLSKIWERIQDGCYTPEAIMKCSECGSDIFHRELEEIRLYMEQLVASGKAEWRKQGGKTDMAKGDCTMLCVPVGTPAGNNFEYQPRVEYA